jgi:valyl-tRNA synthetase
MLSTRFAPGEIEDKWYQHWMNKGYFHSEPNEREPFSIVIPPPNVTGILHMGHMLNNTIQDLLIRKARLEGKNACWVPGTDHASIATEAKVVRWLREEKGLKKSDITRDEFVQYAWQWTEKYGGIILQQLKKLGASCDWERTAFTMDEVRSAGVYEVFVDLYRKGKLYRGLRMVNWDPEAKTVLSNEEVLHQEEDAMLYHVRYKIAGTEDEWITIATQRPETILGDTAIAVNPADPRYAHLKGKKAIVPIAEREVPIIFDDYVDIEFGTGALKVTPAHDQNDYEIGLRHGLEVIDTLNDDGTLNEIAGFFIGVDRFEARKLMKKALEETGQLVQLEAYRTNIGRSERTNAVVEPKLSLQWYVDMKKLSGPALAAVESDEIDFIPKNQKNIYRHWMENIRDWCISRQLWWGHRIPAYYLVDPTKDQANLVFVALSKEEALTEARTVTANPGLSENDLRQDDDVLDTWFSSWLWPITVFDGFNNSKDFNYYYPTSILVTGWDIIFLWVARMAMAGFEWKNQKPFDKVYFTGMVRDKQRRKMSKSLGNSPDVLKLIDDFGADGVRFGVLACSPAGGDLLFDEKLCENGRNFCNKMWNALRLIKGWETTDTEAPEVNILAINWINQKFDTVLGDIEHHFATNRLSDALMAVYHFIWDDFCAWYLEMIKPAYGEPIDQQTLEATLDMYERMMTILHPFMPFITEEIWHHLRDRATGEDCIVSTWEQAGSHDKGFLEQIESAKLFITQIRDIRNSKGLKARELLETYVVRTPVAISLLETPGMKAMVEKMAILSGLELTDEEPANAVSFIVGTEKYYVALQLEINTEEEKQRLSKELDYARGFVRSIEGKLKNEKFVSGAPESVVEAERKKFADGMERIRILEDSLAKLN